jgi:type VI secretion system secreted protein Hcp
MTIDCHLKLDGVKGESTNANHKDEIEVFSWNWNVAQSSSAGTGGGSGIGKAVPGSFNITHNYDKASPILAQKCAKGVHFDSALVTVRKAGGDQQDFLKITMKHVFITSVAPGATSGGEIVETVHMDFDDIEFAYKPQDEKGALGGEVKFGWNPKKSEVR